MDSHLRAMDIFAEEGLKFLGIDKKVKDTGTTEIVILEIKNMFMDYTFLKSDKIINAIRVVKDIDKEYRRRSNPT